MQGNSCLGVYPTIWPLSIDVSTPHNHLFGHFVLHDVFWSHGGVKQACTFLACWSCGIVASEFLSPHLTLVLFVKQYVPAHTCASMQLLWLFKIVTPSSYPTSYAFFMYGKRLYDVLLDACEIVAKTGGFKIFSSVMHVCVISCVLCVNVPLDIGLAIYHTDKQKFKTTYVNAYSQPADVSQNLQLWEQVYMATTRQSNSMFLSQPAWSRKSPALFSIATRSYFGSHVFTSLKKKWLFLVEVYPGYLIAEYHSFSLALNLHICTAFY